MNWYEKLKEYFPVEEMKSKRHMDILLDEKDDVYYKDEGPYHVLMYAEFKDFLFIDYLWVSAQSRGKGIGHQLIEKMKEKNKPIILEVEPIDYEDTDSAKRLRFYQREEFTHAQSIEYNRKSLATMEIKDLKTLTCQPDIQQKDLINNKRKKMYNSINTLKVKEINEDSYK